MHIKFNPNLIYKDKLYGTTKVGARGQVVIPAEARKDLRLKPGDQLLVIGKHNKALGLIRSEDLAEMIEMVMENIVDKKWKDKIKSHIAKIFGDVTQLKKGNK